MIPIRLVDVIFSISKEEFNKLPELGPTAICIKCGLEHEITFVRSRSGDYIFGIIDCCDITWLVGLDGKDIQARESVLEGPNVYLVRCTEKPEEASP